MEAAPPRAPFLPVPASGAPPALLDLLEDGIYLLFLLRGGQGPSHAQAFNERLDLFLARFETEALRAGKSPEAVADAKYALCALLDETILASRFAVREAWEREPLQLRIFGDHLAGEGFFDRLERLRRDPARSVEVLEVYHLCLLVGFQGRYLLDGQEKRSYLTGRVGQELLLVKGGRQPFAPDWKPAHRFQAFLRHELSLWTFGALLAAGAMILFLAFSWALRSRTRELRSAQGPSRLERRA